MMNFANRRILSITVTAVAILLAFGFNHVYASSLRNPMFYTGWVLAIGCIILLLLNFRKKLPVIPIGNAALWLQCHIYLGWFVVGIFLLHAGIRIPAGPLETVLWIVFILIALSGIFGAFLSFEIPKRLAHIKEPILFERIPAFTRQLADEAHDLALQSIVELKTATIAQFYADRLQAFLSAPRNLMGHLFKHSTESRKIFHEMDSLQRYLDSDGQACVQRLRDIVAAKDSLDDQRANLGLLRLWLFIHIPATYSLVILAVVHIVSVYAYSAGAP